jgi:hypothetical protein
MPDIADLIYDSSKDTSNFPAPEKLADALRRSGYFNLEETAHWEIFERKDYVRHKFGPEKPEKVNDSAVAYLAREGSIDFVFMTSPDYALRAYEIEENAKAILAAISEKNSQSEYMRALAATFTAKSGNGLKQLRRNFAEIPFAKIAGKMTNPENYLYGTQALKAIENEFLKVTLGKISLIP